MSNAGVNIRISVRNHASEQLMNLLIYGRPSMPSRLRNMSKRRRKIAIRRRAVRKMMKAGLRFVGQPNTPQVRDDIMDAMNYALRAPFKFAAPSNIVKITGEA